MRPRPISSGLYSCMWWLAVYRSCVFFWAPKTSLLGSKKDGFALDELYIEKLQGFCCAWVASWCSVLEMLELLRTCCATLAKLVCLPSPRWLAVSDAHLAFELVPFIVDSCTKCPLEPFLNLSFLLDSESSWAAERFSGFTIFEPRVCTMPPFKIFLVTLFLLLDRLPLRRASLSFYSFVSIVIRDFSPTLSWTVSKFKLNNLFWSCFFEAVS